MDFDKVKVYFLIHNSLIISELWKSGAEGSRTLVQLWDKLYLLHAYFSIDFREI